MENFDRHTIRQGSTQVEAARALGVADSTLSRYRKKQACPLYLSVAPPRIACSSRKSLFGSQVSIPIRIFGWPARTCRA